MIGKRPARVRDDPGVAADPLQGGCSGAACSWTRVSDRTSLEGADSKGDESAERPPDSQGT